MARRFVNVCHVSMTSDYSARLSLNILDVLRHTFCLTFGLGTHCSCLRAVFTGAGPH